MKKRILVGKIIGFIGFCIFACGMTYIVTHYFEQEKYANINLIATFEDNKEFTLENVEKLNHDEALKTYPYIFTLENKGKYNVDFDLKLKDDGNRSNLDYIIIKNDKEVKSGSLDSLKNDILLNSSVDKKKTDTYKIYIYYSEKVEKPSYKYSLEVIAR